MYYKNDNKLMCLDKFQRGNLFYVFVYDYSHIFGNLFQLFRLSPLDSPPYVYNVAKNYNLVNRYFP